MYTYTKEGRNKGAVVLIPHASTVLLKIFTKKNKAIHREERPNEQAGFRKSRGTRD